MSRSPGRPCTYTREVADAILARLAEGESLASICRDEGMPPRTTFIEWVMDDRDGVADRYTRAREIGLDLMAEELLDIADDGRNDWMERLGPNGQGQGYVVNGEHAQRSKLRVDTRKWYLAKLAPKRYGDRTELHHTSDGSVAEAIAAARQRTGA